MERRGRADHSFLRRDGGGPARDRREAELVARTSRWSGTAETLERWAEHVERQVKPFVAALPGNVGGVFLVDRQSGTALTLTLWESDDAAAETGRKAEQSRASTVGATGVELVERGRWEVVARL
jgi:heme-degrading monooxygenase HmoA